MSSKGWRRVVIKCIRTAPRNMRRTSRASRDLAKLSILCFTPGVELEVVGNITRGRRVGVSVRVMSMRDGWEAALGANNKFV